MLRILHVVGNMDFGGVETLLMEIYRKIDRSVIQFDFLCHNFKNGKFDKEIKNLGGKIYRIPGIGNSGILAYNKNLSKLFCNDIEHKIVHSHLSEINGIILEKAKMAGVPVRISHSHIDSPRYNLLQLILRKYTIAKIPDNTTHAFACSKKATRYLYKSSHLYDKCIILNNAIDTKKFKYNNNDKLNIKNKYNLNGKMIFGHVGRFEEQKNQLFVVDIFKALQHHFPDSVLLLIGVGSMEEKVQVYAEKQGINNKVLFLGAQPDIPALMSAMDVFLFPSLFEGLGIVAIEAQSMGLPVFASDNIPKETKLTDLITYLPLTDSAETWAGVIMDLIKNNRDRPRDKYSAIIKEKGYDIEDVALELQNFYIELDIKS